MINVEDIVAMRAEVSQLEANASDALRSYIADLARATRPTDESFDKVHGDEAEQLRKEIALGCSPRALIWTLRSAAAVAFINGRKAIVPEDVREVFADVARHRILLTPQAERAGKTTDQIIEAALARVHQVQPEHRLSVRAGASVRPASRRTIGRRRARSEEPTATPERPASRREAQIPGLSEPLRLPSVLLQRAPLVRLRRLRRPFGCSSPLAALGDRVHPAQCSQ